MAAARAKEPLALTLVECRYQLTYKISINTQSKAGIITINPRNNAGIVITTGNIINLH